ncbi:beta-glucosidase 24-like protein [Tanacetum coccineum]
MACQTVGHNSDDINTGDFDLDFVWGAATSAYQIEGAASEGGRGPCVWDVFCLLNPGRIVGGDNGNNAVYAYYKTKETPGRRGQENGPKRLPILNFMEQDITREAMSYALTKEGIDYYNNLIDELLANGIESYVTLWHLDTPNVLQGVVILVPVLKLGTKFLEPLNAELQDDIDAALRGLDFMFGWFMEPWFSGTYPDTMINNITDGRLPKLTEEESKLLKGSYDFVGLNYYVSQYATTTPVTNVVSSLTDSMVLEQPVLFVVVWLPDEFPSSSKEFLKVPYRHGTLLIITIRT